MTPLVRGLIHVTIHEARNLPVPQTKRSLFRRLCCRGNKIEAEKEYRGTYAAVLLGGHRICETHHVHTGDEREPTWEDSCHVDVAHEAKYLTVRVFADFLGRFSQEDDIRVGLIHILCEDIIARPGDPDSWRLYDAKDKEEKRIQDEPRWLPLVDKDNKRTDGAIRISLVFLPVDSPEYAQSINELYFKKTSGNKVTLYQDADTPHVPLFDQIKLADGTTYEATHCFRDMYRAIRDAKHFIYITGWAFWTRVQLVRDGEENDISLGKLLLKKQKEGVRILLLIWDELTSIKFFPGVMETHDEKTEAFFKGTGVHVVLAHRNDDDAEPIRQTAYGVFYSHHQKTIITDAAPSNDTGNQEQPRRLVAFVGGLDVQKGRFDTPSHQLFSSLNKEHKHDFHQSSFDTEVKYGPRLPWHDIHCKVEGPAAYDVALNFEERWRREAPSKLKDKLMTFNKGVKDGVDVDLNAKADGGDGWQCQLYRSITDDSADFDSDRRSGLTMVANHLTDNSIYRAYVHHIRTAQKFIYIESQFFLGSAYAWSHDIHVRAPNIVAMEIACRIEDKIKAGERFCVYIVLPMWPEGNPEGKVVQEMLRWQYNTVDMMYKRVAKAISDKGLDAHPRDYLCLFCLGTREEEEVPDFIKQPKKGSKNERLHEKRRFMIYVHSKMMLVDDSHIIVGSANFNERSISGTRDSEIALGAYQDNHVYSNGSLPRGGVHGFRKALWAEHLHEMDPIFDDPSSIECVRKVNEIADKNWEIYSAKKTKDTQGHLMTYPLHIKKNGKVQPLDGDETFPDTNAPVVGKESGILADKLTT